MIKIGDRIKEKRLNAGLTQEELAARLGSSQQQIYKYERGVNEPSASVVYELARILNTTSDWLLGLTDNDERPLRDDRDLTRRERAIISAMRSGTLEELLRVYLADDDTVTV
jgi:transcriptional regulator with XRE-family HTH domain